MNNQEHNVLLFIPDLNGYTEFITSTDSERGHLIIERLLKVIGANNIMDLKISDILGDAFFMYKLIERPSYHQIMEQCIEMNAALDKELNEIAAENEWDHMNEMKNLSLKFVCHFGKVRITDIFNNTQLIGKSVIEVNKLLKNSVSKKSYLLITKKCLEACEESIDGGYVGDLGFDSYAHLGTIEYVAVTL